MTKKKTNAKTAVAAVKNTDEKTLNGTHGTHASPKFNANARQRDENGLCVKDHVALYIVSHADADNIEIRENVKFRGKKILVPDTTLSSWRGSWNRGYNFPRVAYEILAGRRPCPAGKKIPTSHAFGTTKKIDVHVANDNQSHEDYLLNAKKKMEDAKKKNAKTKD